MKNLQNIALSLKLIKSPLKCVQLCTFPNKLFAVRITIDLIFKTIFSWHTVSVKPGLRAAKPIFPPYVLNLNRRDELL